MLILMLISLMLCLSHKCEPGFNPHTLLCIQENDLKFAESTVFSALFGKVSWHKITSRTPKILFFAQNNFYQVQAGSKRHLSRSFANFDDLSDFQTLTTVSESKKKNTCCTEKKMYIHMS